MNVFDDHIFQLIMRYVDTNNVIRVSHICHGFYKHSSWKRIYRLIPLIQNCIRRYRFIMPRSPIQRPVTKYVTPERLYSNEHNVTRENAIIMMNNHPDIGIEYLHRARDFNLQLRNSEEYQTWRRLLHIEDTNRSKFEYACMKLNKTLENRLEFLHHKDNKDNNDFLYNFYQTFSNLLTNERKLRTNVLTQIPN